MLKREYPDLYIDGGWHRPDSTEVFEVVSPSSGKPIGHVPSASDGDIDAAVAAAHRAFYETDWPRRPVRERAELCRKPDRRWSRDAPSWSRFRSRIRWPSSRWAICSATSASRRA